MDSVVLGRTRLKVSVMGLGAGGDSRLGVPQGNYRAAVALVRSAIDQGVNFIDTAEAYGTEAVVGHALAGVDRSRLVLSTKKTTHTEQPIQPDDVIHSLEASLRRLGTDYIDIYHLHGVRPEAYTDLRERVVPVLLRLKEQGKIRFLGITEAFAADPSHRTLELALADDLFDVVMVGFNLLNQSARRSVFPRTLERNVGTLIMFAVRRALSRPDRLRELLAELAANGKIRPETARAGLEFLLADHAATSLPDAAYRFCRDEPGAHVVLSGTGDPQHLADNVRSLSAPSLPSPLRARLAELFGDVDDVSGH